MSTYNARVPADQQYQLIMECRSNGLTDYQWCKDHGIHPGTFYNWVRRLRTKACHDIPVSVSREHLNLHSAALQLAAQIVMKVIHTSKFSCYNRLDYKGIPASVSDAPTRLFIDVQVRLST